MCFKTPPCVVVGQNMKEFTGLWDWISELYPWCLCADIIRNLAGLFPGIVHRHRNRPDKIVMLCVKFACVINMPTNKNAINFIWVHSRKDTDVKFCKICIPEVTWSIQLTFFFCIHGIQTFLAPSSAHPASQGGHSYSKICCSEEQLREIPGLQCCWKEALCCHQ